MHVTRKETSRRFRLDPRFVADISKYDPLPRAEIETITREMRALRVKAWASLGERNPSLRAAEDVDCIDLRAAISAAAKSAAARDFLRQFDTLVARMERHNLRLVVHEAQKFVYHPAAASMTLDDLAAYGCIGLRTAVLRFDPDRGFAFSTMASWWIRHAVGRAVIDHGPRIRIPVHLADRIVRIKKAMTAIMTRAAMEGVVMRRPSPAQIADELKLEEHLVVRALEVMDLQDELSLDLSMHNGQGDSPAETRTLMDLIPDEAEPVDDTMHEQERISLLGAAVQRLARRDPKMGRVVTERLGLGGQEPRLLRDVAVDMNLSRERIRQIENKAWGVLADDMRAAEQPRSSAPIIRRRTAPVGPAVQQEMSL